MTEHLDAQSMVWGVKHGRITRDNKTIIISKSFRPHVVHVYKACTL